MNSYFKALRKYAVFRGRASRSDYWLFMLFYALALSLALILDEVIGTRDGEFWPIAATVQILHLIPAVSVLARRVHDLDRTAWWLLLWLTGIGGIVLFVFSCIRGTPGPNRFGPDPLGGAAAEVIHAQPHDPVAEIERLGELRAKGSLSEAEFEVMKARALSQGSRA